MLASPERCTQVQSPGIMHSSLRRCGVLYRPGSLQYIAASLGSQLLKASGRCQFVFVVRYSLNGNLSGQRSMATSRPKVLDETVSGITHVLPRFSELTRSTWLKLQSSLDDHVLRLKAIIRCLSCGFRFVFPDRSRS